MPVPDLTAPRLPIVAWDDPVIDAVGYDPRSPYVETFWLGIIGPSTTWLLRHVADRLDAAPGGFELHLAEAAIALGLGTRGGRNAPLVRSLARACQFGAAMFTPDGSLAVRRRLAPLTHYQLNRLTPALQAAHDRWMQDRPAPATAAQQQVRCRRLALSLVELGEDVEGTERHLHRWHFHPALAREAALWARDQHALSAEPMPLADLGGDAA